MSTKGNAGNTLLLTCCIVILPRLPHPFLKTSIKGHGVLKVIKGKLRKCFINGNQRTLNKYEKYTSIKQKLTRKAFLFHRLQPQSTVSIDRTRHINLVGHLFSDHTLLNLKQEQQENFISLVVTMQMCSGLKCLTNGLQVKIKLEAARFWSFCRFLVEIQCRTAIPSKPITVIGEIWQGYG